MDEQIFNPKDYVLYFERSVLAQYREAPERYQVKDDAALGEVKTLHEHVEVDEQNHLYFRVRFGRRRLANGDMSIAAYTGDLGEMPEAVKKKWRGFVLESPVFTEDDPDFENFLKQLSYGGPPKDSFPLLSLRQELQKIYNLTKATLGINLFKHAWLDVVAFPNAENSMAYRQAHFKLYQLLIDGLQKDALVALAKKLNVNLTDAGKTLNSFWELLPKEIKAQLHPAFETVRQQRNKEHGIPSEGVSVPFDAAEQFKKNTQVLVNAVCTLREWLEKELHTSSQVAEVRLQRLESLPKITGGVDGAFFLTSYRPKLEGKTIKSARWGSVEQAPGTHQSEGMVLEFEDDSVLGLDVSCNAGNLLEERVREFRTHLDLIYVPALDEEEE